MMSHGIPMMVTLIALEPLYRLWKSNVTLVPPALGPLVGEKVTSSLVLKSPSCNIGHEVMTRKGISPGKVLVYTCVIHSLVI